MNSHLTITETSNIDWKNNKVIDEKKIEKRTIHWETDIRVSVGLDGEEKTIKMKKISLFDHILLLDDKKYVVLHMLSKKLEKDRDGNEWAETHFKLSNGTLLKIFHNLPNQINAAFENWLIRHQDTPTEESFCEYINSKRLKGLTDHIAYTEKEYKELVESFKGS